MPLTPEEAMELEVLKSYEAQQGGGLIQAALPAASAVPQGGLTTAEAAELEALQAYEAETANGGETGGILDMLASGAANVGEYFAKPALDAIDIYQQGLGPGLRLPESVGERAESTNDTGFQIAQYASPAAFGSAGFNMARQAGSNFIGRALVTGGSSAVGEGTGELVTSLAQGERPDLDLTDLGLAATLGTVASPVGEALGKVAPAVSGFTERVFGGPGLARAPAPQPGLVVDDAASQAAGAVDDVAGAQAFDEATASGWTVRPKTPAAPQATSGAGQATTKASKFQRQVQILDDAGIGQYLTPGQRTGNTSLIAEETTAAPTALGGKIQANYEAQAQATRSRLMEMAGFEPEDIAEGLIDPDTVANAGARFSQRYAQAFEGVEVKFDTDAFEKVIDDVAERHVRRITLGQKPEVNRAVDDLRGLADQDLITGADYQDMRSLLGARERNYLQRDPGISDMYRDMKGALDDAFAASTTKENAALKRQIDWEYRNYKVLQKASEGGGADVAAGEPTIRNIANKARNRKTGGTKEFRELADAAQAITVDRVANSGTPTRLELIKGLKARANMLGIRAGQAAGLGGGSAAAVAAVPMTERTSTTSTLVGTRRGSPSVTERGTVPASDHAAEVQRLLLEGSI